jgi:hypothetical protein
VYATATEDELKHHAAALRAHMTEDDVEEETWLRKSDPRSPIIQDALLQLEAQRALREGRLEDADKALAKCVAYRARDAKHNAAAANNTATALSSRFRATGDIAHVRESVRYLEDAVRLAPDNALVMGNLADAQEYLGVLNVLERWARMKVLRPRPDEAHELLEALLAGPMREEVLRAVDQEPALRRSQELSQQEQTLSPGKVSAWTRQLRWQQWHRDAQGMAALSKRLEALPPFEGKMEAEQRRKWEAGERDAILGKMANQSVTWAEATLKRARQTNHAQTIASASYLLGEALAHQRYFETKLEQLDGMVEAYRQAAKLWPELGTSNGLEWALTRSALERSVAKSEALAKVWKEERRTHAMSTMMHHALAGAAGAEAAAVLRSQPELREAAEHARERAKTRPEVEDWVLAKAAGDTVLEQAAAAVFSRPDAELELTIATRLAGGLAREKAQQELFQQGKGAHASVSP